MNENDVVAIVAALFLTSHYGKTPEESISLARALVRVVNGPPSEQLKEDTRKAKEPL